MRILTNSLSSNDVGIVHAGYATYRKALLRGGDELYELNKKLSRQQRKEKKGAGGSSKASLHAKSFVFDRRQVFIGSLNLDPRSLLQDTEIGVVIGFGLQKVVPNLISGVILLLDKSIKPGDVIEVGDSYGRIDSLGARYVSVATRDGLEFLIPNEDLITQQVINWSFSNALVRLKIGVGVSYDTDIHHAMDLMVQAASGVDRVLEKPGPVCQLKNFGDNAVDLELRMWVNDPDKGISNVSSAVRVAIWDVFKEHNVEIPFPQRDVHIIPQS